MQLIPQAVLLAFVGLLVTAAASDIRAYRIPNWTSLAIALLFPLYVVSATYLGPEGLEVPWLASAGVAAATFTVLVVLFALGWVGGGDVKLIGATSLWAGPQMLAAFIAITAFAGGILATVFLIWSRLGSGARGTLKAHANKSEMGRRESEKEAAGKRAQVPIPYGVAIACGGMFVAGKHIINHFGQ